ncbi:DMP19 family protein [uncultured Kordia sp.]|uniref:DMP19 family protein n=1 Tax=uncultured Kordia sp. TaxID=507699 RepID=UPI002629E31A|nr:DMP19 family protein [uncultured Kordia sp.]
MKKFLNRIFGKKATQDKLQSKSLDEILQLEDATETVIQIDELLWGKSKNDTNFESLNDYEKNVLFIGMLEREVNNGGFDQYFFNSSGEYAHETLTALKDINAPKMAAILHQAIKIFPTVPIPKNAEARRECMEKISETITDNWDSLDNEFYQYPENLTELSIEYVKNNKSKFQL